MKKRRAGRKVILSESTDCKERVSSLERNERPEKAIFVQAQLFSSSIPSASLTVGLQPSNFLAKLISAKVSLASPFLGAITLVFLLIIFATSTIEWFSPLPIFMTSPLPILFDFIASKLAATTSLT